MDRQQAVNVIKEIFEECQLIEGKSIKLLPPEANPTLSNTFQIHIDTNSNPSLEACIKDIAKRHNLAVATKSNYAVIYKPYPNEKTP